MTGSGNSLGGASFQVVADIRMFQDNLKDAKTASLQASQRIAKDMTNIADVTGRESAKAARELDKTPKAAERLQKQIGEEATKKTAKFGMGLMALGNAVDDLQYGFKAIVNNIPQVLYLMGASGGVAGGAVIAAVAVNQLSQRWDQLADAMRAGWLNMAAADLARVRMEAEKAGIAFDKFFAQETPEVAKRIQGIRDIFQGAPGGPAGILKGVREAAMIHPAFKPTETPEAQKERASLEATIKAIDKKGGPKGQEAIIYAAAKERLKKMDDDLFKQLEERVKTLLGKVIEGNETALGELMVLAKQFPKSFQFYLYGALRTLTPERMKRTEDRENTKLDRELREKNEREEEAVNKAAAAKMVTGPIGTAILHGAKSNEETAATPEQMQKMMRKNLRDSPSGERMMAEMTKRGFTPSQVKQAMDALDPRAVDKRARQIIERPENKDTAKLGKFGQVLPNFVGQAREELFNEAIKRGIEPAVSPLEEAAKRLMKEAGIAGDPKGVVAEIRKLLEDRRSDIMARTGATKEQAEEIMKREQMHAGQAAFGQPAQRMGLVEFSHMTQGGILNNNIPAQQLEQLRKMNITLDMIARHGRPRVPAVAGK